MMMQLQQDLAEKEKELVRLQESIQEYRVAGKPSIATANAITMAETNLLSSLSIDISQD